MVSDARAQHAILKRPDGRYETPKWAFAPRAKDLSALYPGRARDHGKSGVAIVDCTVNPEGRLSACRSVCDAPLKYDFDRAGVWIAKKFRVEPTLDDGSSSVGSAVRLILTFPMPESRLPTECDAAAAAPF